LRARQERRDVQLLPCGEVIPYDNSYFRVEHRQPASIRAASVIVSERQGSALFIFLGQGFPTPRWKAAWP
jgi:hypothetical protein